jgi:hypothetical protein
MLSKGGDIMNQNFCPFVRGDCREDCKFFSKGLPNSHCAVREGLESAMLQNDEISAVRQAIEKAD